MNVEQHEQKWEKLLKIKTTGRDATNSDQYRYPYEPTPYAVLERLANSGYIQKKDVVMDYGCGKGRVEFFLSYQLKCRTIGIEYDTRIFEKAMGNKETAISGVRTTFQQVNAEHFPVPQEITCFYFFNPFSIELLRKVMGRVLDSYYNKPREIKLFFYYPSDDYLAYLMTVEELEFEDSIACQDLFPGEDQREQILVFGIHM